MIQINKIFSVVSISLLGILVYSNTFQCPFQFDDQNFIVENSFIRHLGNLQDIWSFWPYRFITYLSLALNYHFYQLNVFGYHLFNLMVHLGTAILVWWLVRLTLLTPIMKDNKIAKHIDLIALLVGLVFVSHPIQTNAVTFIWQRAASMAALFYLASLCFYVKARLLEGNSKGDIFHGLSILAAVLAMFTKEITITLPVMILFYECTFLSTKNTRPWKRLVPFLFTLLIIPLTMLLTKSVNFHELRRTVEDQPGISSIHYFLTQLRVICIYIRLLVLPLHQSLEYDYSISKSFFEMPVLWSFLFLSTILFIAKRLFLNYRLIAFFMFWFFLTLLPESSFIPLMNVIYEYRLYLPMVGYSVFLTVGLYYLLGTRSIKTMVFVLMAVILCNSILTYQRNSVWSDSFTLWNDAITKNPQNPRSYNNRGLAYFKRNDLSHALEDFNKSIEMGPYFFAAYNNRADLYYKEGHIKQALTDYNKAIEINPNNVGAYNNRGVLFYHQVILEQALADFNKAIAIDSHYADAYYNLGLTYGKLRDFNQALLNYNKFIELNPNSADAYNNRSFIYGLHGMLDLALSDSNKAIEINSKFAEAYCNRAVTYFQLKDYDHSWRDVKKAKELGCSSDSGFINALKKVSGKNN